MAWNTRRPPENLVYGGKETIMDRSTRNKVWGLVWALMLGAGSVGFSQDIYLFGGEVVAGDPNATPADVNEPDPANTWRRAEFRVMTNRLYNPAKTPARDPNASTGRCQSMASSVGTSNGLIGLDHVPGGGPRPDQDGKEFYSKAQTSRISPRYV
jgi:hypothetical protein